MYKLIIILICTISFMSCEKEIKEEIQNNELTYGELKQRHPEDIGGQSACLPALNCMVRRVTLPARLTAVYNSSQRYNGFCKSETYDNWVEVAGLYRNYYEIFGGVNICY